MLLHYSNLAKPQPLLVAVSDSDTELSVPTTEGYPDTPFLISLDRGLYDDSLGDSLGDEANEEVCLVTDKTATTFTVIRGYDGTVATAHGAGVWIEHVTTAKVHREGIIASTTEAVRDTLAGDELWDGRIIFNQDVGQIEVAVDGQWETLIPPGVTIPFVGASAPLGWLMCEGQNVSRTTYARLFAAIGTAYGAGNGTTTFGLPDLRQRIPLGKADSGVGDALGESGGSISHTHSQPSHTHSGPSHNHSMPNTNTASSHNHTQGRTGNAGGHSHGSFSTGNALVGSETPDVGTSGLFSKSDIDHSHGSHSHSGGSTDPGATTTTESGHNHGVLGDSHSHSVGSASMSSYLVPNRMRDHTHSISGTGSVSSHDHALSTVNSNGSHSHSIGNTGNAGAGQTSSGGNDTTGAANPPYIVLNYIIRV